MTKEMINEREKTHGNFYRSARVSQALKQVCNGAITQTMSPAQREAIDMICFKLARIICGNPNFKDHWIDLIGYSELILRELSEIEPF